MSEEEKVKGKVTKVLKKGAYVELEDGRKGRIHISQIADEYVRAVEEYLRVGDEIEARVVGESDEGYLELSLRSPGSRRKKEARSDPRFEKMLRNYLKSSEESHGILKRRREGRK